MADAVAAADVLPEEPAARYRPAMPRPVSRTSFETRVWWYASAALAPALLALLLALWSFGASSAWWWGLGLPVLVASVIAVARLREQVVYPLYTLANLLEALREGDYSLRGSRAQRGDAVGEVIWEVNALSQTLREQRLRVEESAALLAKVLASIDIAIFAFDDAGRLRLINPAGARLIARKATDAQGLAASELGLAGCLGLAHASTLKASFPGGSGSFEVRHAQFREHGRPHQLLAITDLSRALRAEERQAWQRLIRVLGHELNNSLAPIRSMAGTLSTLLGRTDAAEDWREDAASGLAVIGSRAEALSRFMSGYTALARLPPPQRRTIALVPLLERVVRLEQRLPIALPEERVAVELEADPDQLEQALINLTRNAVEAALAEAGAVRLSWASVDGEVRIEIEDDGPGLPPSENLFVPFFTTKPGGSGIGLVLATQIVEAHGGRLTLRNRAGARGVVAAVALPLT